MWSDRNQRPDSLDRAGGDAACADVVGGAVDVAAVGADAVASVAVVDGNVDGADVVAAVGNDGPAVGVDVVDGVVVLVVAAVVGAALVRSGCRRCGDGNAIGHSGSCGGSWNDWMSCLGLVACPPIRMRSDRSWKKLEGGRHLGSRILGSVDRCICCAPRSFRYCHPNICTSNPSGIRELNLGVGQQEVLVTDDEKRTSGAFHQNCYYYYCCDYEFHRLKDSVP